MLLSKQKCLFLNGVLTESQNFTSVLQISLDFFSNKNYNTYKSWNCTEFCEAFTHAPLWKYIYVQFYGMINQRIVGIPMGINYYLLILT